MDEVIIIIPIYTNDLNPFERASLQQNISVLQNQQINIVAPKGLEISIPEVKGIPVEYFDSAYFANIDGYNKLLLSIGFYERFSRFTYLAIVQTDVWLFGSEFSFLKKNHIDYCGSPWLDNPWAGKVYYFLSTSPDFWYRSVLRLFFILKKKELLVGNGGFSWRNISKSKKILQWFPAKSISSWPFHEDIFWSLVATCFHPFFKLATLEQALQFGFEEKPSACFQLNQKRLPLGTHAWWKHDVAFWEPYISKNHT